MSVISNRENILNSLVRTLTFLSELVITSCNDKSASIENMLRVDHALSITHLLALIPALQRDFGDLAGLTDDLAKAAGMLRNHRETLNPKTQQQAVKALREARKKLQKLLRTAEREHQAIGRNHT